MNSVALHLWLNHLAPVLLLVALPLGLWALLSGHRFGLRFSLLLQGLAYASIWLSLLTGEAALQYLSASQDPTVGATHLSVHEALAYDFVWLYALGSVSWVLALLAEASGIVRLRFLHYPLLVVGLICLLALFVIAHAGGEIRHPALQ